MKRGSSELEVTVVCRLHTLHLIVYVISISVHFVAAKNQPCSQKITHGNEPAHSVLLFTSKVTSTSRIGTSDLPGVIFT